jgi:hypothetical protein
VAIFGTNLKNASINNAKGEHLFYDNKYQSEYQQCYDEIAKKNYEIYLKKEKERKSLPNNMMTTS